MGIAARVFAFAQAMTEGEVEEIEFVRGRIELRGDRCEGWRRRCPRESSREVSQLVKRCVLSGKKGRVPPGWKDDADEFGEVDGVDVLVAGVEAEEDGCGCVLERVCGVVGVGEVVAGEGDDDLGVAVGQDALVAVRGGWVAGVPEGFDVRAEGGMRAALEVEHASASVLGGI